MIGAEAFCAELPRAGIGPPRVTSGPDPRALRERFEGAVAAEAAP